MKKYLFSILKVTSISIVATFAVVGTAVFALSFPTNSPTGETVGGKFMSYFDKILVNTDIATTNGMVKDSDKVDGLHAADLAGGLGATGTPSKPFVVQVENSATCPSGWHEVSNVELGGNNRRYLTLGDQGSYLVPLYSRGNGSMYAAQTTNMGGNESNKFCIFFY